MRIVWKRVCLLSLTVVFFVAQLVCADDAAPTRQDITPPAKLPDAPHPNPDSRGRNTAVALNYCRASFHRIRRYQSKRVLIEEQEKILNNLNLNGIGDEEVIKLYSAVLDEISRIQIADKETAVLQEKFRKGLYRQVGATVLTMSTQMALASVDGAVRSGVNSWLDYRDLSWSREFDIWKVDKERMQAVVEKSTNFLDTFWKLAQKKNIPDKWLVRGDDLDALEEAVRDPEPEKRLRILRRMEPFMECYPPYWYYVARALQARGHFQDAEQTYDRVAELGFGHFRKDDMLAASLSNRAIIREFLKLPDADRAAKEALAHSSGVWEANLMCAQVLERHGQVQEAEDAILRNLDVDLERTQSAVALVGLYYRQDRQEGLARVLGNDDFLAVLPVHSILQCAEKLTADRVPLPAVNRLRDSLSVAVETRFGADDVLVNCDAIWLGHAARIRYLGPGTSGIPQVFENPPSPQSPTGELTSRFRSCVEVGNALGTSNTALLGSVVTFYHIGLPADAQPISVVLGSYIPKRNSKTSLRGIVASPAEIRMGDFHLKLQNEVPTALTPDQSADRRVEGIPADRRAPRIRIIDIIALPAVGLPNPNRQPANAPPPP